MRLHQVTIDRKSLSEEVIYKYGDAHAGFRELIQNAKDAILDQYDLHSHESKTGTIIVNIFPTLVEVTDNGIGMDVGAVDDFLLKMYGTSKNRTVRNRAGVFGRGFFAIFKEATEVLLFTKKEDMPPMYLRVYPKDNWFIAEELTLTEIPSKAVPYVRKFGTHGTTVLCIPRTGFVTDAIYNYLTQTCQFFDIPLILNGQKINRTFEEVLRQRDTRAIVTFDKLGVQGALGYKANDNMIQTFVFGIKILNLISPEGGVNGFINYDKLEVTPSRDALVQNENYKIFINVLTEMCNSVLKKLSEDPTSDDYQRLTDFAYSSDNVTILKNLKIFKLVGQEDKLSLHNLIIRAEKKRLVFVAEERTVLADRLKKRGYIVVNELSPRLKELLIKAIRDSGMTLSQVDTPLGRKLAGTLEPRRIIPENQLSPNEKELVEIVKSMVPDGMKIEIMEGDLFDDAEHVPGIIRLQRNGELMHLALDLEVITYPFMVKVILTPLIAHEITHEQIGTIHDESFYEIYESILKTMHRKLVDEFKELVKSEKI